MVLVVVLVLLLLLLLLAVVVVVVAARNLPSLNTLNPFAWTTCNKQIPEGPEF